MLFRMLDEVVQRLEALDKAREAPVFARELQLARADLFGPLAGRLGRAGAERVAQTIAGCQFGLIGEIPLIVDAVRQAVDSPSTHPAVRCAMLGTLAYLVQPRDLIPDDRPGGFGFVDDCMILRATVSEYFDMLPPGFTSRERERDHLRLLSLCVAPDRRDRFQEAVDGVWRLFQSLLVLPPGEVDRVSAEMIRTPLEHGFPVPEVDPRTLAAGPVLCEFCKADSIRLESDRVVLCFPDGVTLELAG